MATMNSPFKAAKRQNRKLRAAIDGPSGSGKSYSALRLAFALKAAGLCKNIAAIDTESESLSLYAGESPDGIPWQFDTLNLKQFSPTQFTASISEAVKHGYDCIVIDSLSHAWIGKDGALDLVDKKDVVNKFTAWKDVTPMHREMIDAITGCKAHIIVTMRSKTEYVMETDTNKQGKTIQVPRKIGMAPVQRDGMEYEFDIYGSMDWSHQFKISKSRCSIMQDRTAVKPGPSFWNPLFEWLEGIETVERTGPKTALEETVEETETRKAREQGEAYEKMKLAIESANDPASLSSLKDLLKSESGKIESGKLTVIRNLYAEKRDALNAANPVTAPTTVTP